ncbi:NACHT domain-containing protein [Streptosporangium sp. CA-115845]|uniref:NACHT domain-containing protein n=1 Tax=Streptosporangium sp. CA-115845 TaxID=3240071 RepID=UPI003D93D52E
MRTGRPPSAERKRLPELEALADWFVQAIDGFGHGSIRRTAELTGLSQRALYDAVNAERMLPLRLVRALAEGLGQDPEDIARLWAEAKRQRDRAEEAERRKTHPHPAAWEEIPLPSPALRDLLEAQDGILNCLPYSLLGLVEPPLSAIYVRQQIRHRPDPQPSDVAEQPPVSPSGGGDNLGSHSPHPDGTAELPSRSTRNTAAHLPAADLVFSLSDALARYDHLLITGEAGAGKSTLASHMVRSLCGVWVRRSSFHDAPTTEPLLPLRVSASLLAAERGSWSERVRRAALSMLGGVLVADPPASLFVGRTQGARWIIFVDGIDEITDRRHRAELIRTLSRHCHRESDFRLVVMSRPLPSTEFAPLREARLGEFEIQPFERPELEDYTRKWFDQQCPRAQNPAAAADRFLAEVVDEGELKELVRNPLLATMALANATLEPTLPPSSSRLALYGSFLERLRDRAPQHAGDAFPAWLTSSVDELVRQLARLRAEGEKDLVAAGRAWLRRHVPGPLPPGWESEFPAALAGTGLLVVTGEQVRFLHQSFAEFLASFDYAGELPTDGTGLETWIRRACDGAQRSLALFVLCQWAARAGCSPDAVIDRIFVHPSNVRTLLAGSLLAEGLEPEPGCADRVIRRLIALVRVHADDMCDRAATALAVLDRRFGTRAVLEELAEAPELVVDARFYALSALSRIAPPAVTAPLLVSMLEVLYTLLPKAARLANQLDEQTRQAVRERLKDLLAELDADAWEYTIAAEAYGVLGAAEEAERFARRVLEDPLADSHDVRRAVAVWLGSSPAPATIARLVGLGYARPRGDHAGRMAIALALEQADALDEAAELTQTIVDARDKATHVQREAAELWLRIRGSHEAEPVHRLLSWYDETGSDLWRQVRLIRCLLDAGVEHPSREWARERLAGEHALAFGSEEVISLAIIGQEPEAAAVIVSRYGDALRLHTFNRAEYAKSLLDNGLPDEAFRVAESTLRCSSARDVDCHVAAGVLLKIDRLRAVETLRAQLEGMSTSAWGAGVIEALDDDGMPDLDELSLRIAERVLVLPEVESFHVQTALGVIATYGGHDRMTVVIEGICRHPALTFSQQRRMAQILAASGEDDAARAVWRHLLSVRGRASDNIVVKLLEDIAQVLTYKGVMELVREALESGPKQAAHQRRRLERMMSWLASSPARG